MRQEHAATEAAVESLYQLANYDSLTSLANRAAFSRQLEAWLDDAAEHESRFVLFLIDLDDFKSVNDMLGHRAGDGVLTEVARRLSRAFPGPHVAARLGGDEFAVICLLAEDAGPDIVATMANRVVTEVNGPFLIEERNIDICISFGVAIYPADGTAVADLLANADLALDAAKKSGRDHWRRVDVTLLDAARTARHLDRALADALRTGGLEVWYQPQIVTATGALCGLEALIRWDHPVHGWITPGNIVATAWRMRIPEQLTAFVLDQACQKIRVLADAGFAGTVVAINISPRELGQYDLPGLVGRCIAQHGIHPSLLELEITEETLADSPAAIAALRDLASLGVRLAIDDFGMGCSSLAYLRSFRANRIKIDRSFVTGFAGRPDDQILVQAILGIGRSFNIDVLAEGVETAEEAALLRAFGCQVVQGYYFGQPMKDGALDHWLSEQRRTDSAYGRAHEARAALPASVIPAVA